MLDRTRAFALVAGVATLMALAAGSAAANTLSLDETAFTAEWTGLSFGEGSTIICPLTLTGSLHEPVFAKTPDARIGVVTSATFAEEECSSSMGSGEAAVLGESLPWDITYDSFAGTLPAITGIAVNLLGTTLEVFNLPFGISCLYEGTLEAIVNVSEGIATTLRASETSEIPLIEGGFLCPGFAHFAGEAAISAPDDDPITVTLDEAPPPADPAALQAEPSSVVVTPSEESDRFTVTNIGDEAATGISTSLTGVDRESPEFELSSSGCDSTLADGASCVYTIVVASRPLAEASVVFEYDDGTGDNRTLRVPVEIDPLEVTSTPSELTVAVRDQNGVFTLRNGSTGAVTITRVDVTTSDPEAPDFEARAPGCSSTLGPEETCNYVVTVNERPEESGRVTIHYRGAGGQGQASVTVDIAGEPPQPAELVAEPSRVAIERLESNDSFVLRNAGRGATSALITRIDVVAADRERPEFEVVGPGCSLLVLDGTSCTYIVTVNSRPQREGRVVFEYQDGTGEDRTTTVLVDIES